MRLPPAEQVPLRARAGTTLTVDVTALDEFGQPLALAGKVVRFEVAPQAGATPAVAVSAAPHVTLLAPGRVRVQLPPDETRLLTGGGGGHIVGLSS